MWWVLCLGLVLCGCPATEPKPDTLGLLKTDAEGNLVVFSGAKRSESNVQTFTLYNAGRIPVLIESMSIRSDSFAIFQVQPRIEKPVELKPGQANGLTFTINFRPDSAGKFRASLVFTSPNVENVDDEGNFLVHLYGQVADDGTGGTGLLLSCAGMLDFGEQASGVSVDRSCDITNVTTQPIVLNNVSYRRTRGGDEFRWLEPLMPLTLAAGARITATIRYTPDGAKSEGVFTIETDPPRTDKPIQIKTKGTEIQ